MELFQALDLFEGYLWTYLGFPVILGFGLYLSIKSRFVQIRSFPKVLRTFASFLRVRETEKGAIHPLKAFFAALGGALGIGNVVAVCTAIQIGGPGALFWFWVTTVIGVILKYAEVYLGIKYRVSDGQGGYSGGPMYFLKKAFGNTWAPKLVAVLLCLYGVEIYQFNVITTSVSTNLGISEWVNVVVLLALVIFAGLGGVKRVGTISSAIVPVFVVMYAGMGGWILFDNFAKIPHVISEVFLSAFTGHAALGGFLGSTMMMAISQGVRRGCYTADIGIGYASVIYSESSEQNFEKLSSLVLFGIFLDTFVVCTTSIMLILVLDIWLVPMDASMMVQTALAQYFPYMHFFMPFFLFILGYSTINAYFVVGLKCADYLSPRWGKAIFYAYAITALITFAFVDQSQAQSVMMVIAGLLLLLNCAGMWRLRNEISFNI